MTARVTPSSGHGWTMAMNAASPASSAPHETHEGQAVSARARRCCPIKTFVDDVATKASFSNRFSGPFAECLSAGEAQVLSC